MGLPIFREPSPVEHKEVTNPESSAAYRRSIIRRTHPEGRNAQQTYEAILGERARQRQALRQRRSATTSHDTEGFLLDQERFRQYHRQSHNHALARISGEQEDRANLVLPPIAVDPQAITSEPGPSSARPRSRRGPPTAPADDTPLPTELDIALFPPLERVDRVRSSEDSSRAPEPPRSGVDGLGDRTRSVTPEVDLYAMADELVATSFQGDRRARDGTIWSTFSLANARGLDNAAAGSPARGPHDEGSTIPPESSIRWNPRHSWSGRTSAAAAAIAAASRGPNNGTSTTSSSPWVPQEPDTLDSLDDTPSSPDPLICDDPSPINDPEEQRRQSTALLRDAEALLERATTQLLQFDLSQVASESYMRGWLVEAEGFRVMLERVAGRMRGQEEWLNGELRVLHRDRERESL